MDNLWRRLFESDLAASARLACIRRPVIASDRPAADGRPIAPELRSVDRPPAAAYQLAEADRAAASKPRLRPAA